MSEIANIAQQLKAAANKILGEIKIIDNQIAELQKQRDSITSSKVTKEDFLTYLAAHFRIKAETFELKLSREMFPRLNFDFGSLERGFDNNHGFAGTFPLTASPVPQVISEDAVYFYFSDIILEKIGDSLSGYFDDNCMPVSELRQALSEIEATKKTLLSRRDELVKTLDDSGISRH
jgi:hypothetical protein